MKGGGAYRRDPVVGRCWACALPVHRTESVRVWDRSVGFNRLVHRDRCAERAEQMLRPGMKG